MRRLGLVALLILIATLALSAARLVLRDGTVVFGRFVSGSPREIIFQDTRGVQRRFDISRIEDLDFTTTTAYANPYREQAVNPATRGEASRYENAYAVLPAGSEIVVRTEDSINSQTAVPGQTYRATIDHDVFDERGQVAIPRGSQADMVIRSVNPGGTVKGGEMVLDLQSVWVNGQTYLVSATDVERRSTGGIGANRRTGEYVGGGAVLGTLLGAIAGGGKGAAIGALASAAGGGTAQVLTRGKEVRVPAETQLTFRLDRPLQLNQMPK